MQLLGCPGSGYLSLVISLWLAAALHRLVKLPLIIAWLFVAARAGLGQHARVCQQRLLASRRHRVNARRHSQRAVRCNGST